MNSSLVWLHINLISSSHFSSLCFVSLRTSHFTLRTSHFALHTSHLTLHTSHFTLRFSMFTHLQETQVSEVNHLEDYPFGDSSPHVSLRYTRNRLESQQANVVLRVCGHAACVLEYRRAALTVIGLMYSYLSEYTPLNKTLGLTLSNLFQSPTHRNKLIFEWYLKAREDILFRTGSVVSVSFIVSGATVAPVNSNRNNDFFNFRYRCSPDDAIQHQSLCTLRRRPISYISRNEKMSKKVSKGSFRVILPEVEE